jgi:hypothetical protein
MFDTEVEAESTTSESASASPSAAEQSDAVDAGTPDTTPSADTTGESASDDQIGPLTRPDDVWSEMVKDSAAEADANASEGTEEATTTPDPATEKQPDDKATAAAAAETDQDKPLIDRALEEAFGEAKPDGAEDPKAVDQQQQQKDRLTDEELDKLDPEEQIKGQRNASAEAWARRNHKRAEIVKAFQFGDKPITEVAEQFRELNPQRYSELAQTAAHELVDTNPEATFQRAYAVAMLKRNPYLTPEQLQIPTLDDVIERLAGANGTAAAAPATDPAAAAAAATADVELPPEFAELETQLNGHDWRDPAKDEDLYDEREQALVKTLRSLERSYKETAAKMAAATKPAPAAADAKPEEKAEPATATPVISEAEQTELRGQMEKTVNDYRDTLEKKVLPWIKRATGLEVTQDDTPQIANFKENLLVLYTGTDYQRANNLPSAFESFASNESSVSDELGEVWDQIVQAQVQETIAKRAGNKAEAAKFHKEAEDFMPSVVTLLGKAHEEFRAKRVDPQLAVLEGIATSATRNLDASQRVEIATSGGGEVARSPMPEREAETADDVWDNVVKDAAEEERLRATG